jgi:hypothetical protein
LSRREKALNQGWGRVNRAAAEPTNEHLDLDKLLEEAMAQRAATLKPEHPNN